MKAVAALQLAGSPAGRFKTFGSFLAHREDIRYVDEELSVEQFGFQLYTPRGFRYPDQKDDWWESYPDTLVRVADYRVKTEQLTVYASTVEHYLMTPMLASEYGQTWRQDIAPRVLVSEETKTLYLAEGNHRCAAAMVSGKPILMRLAPLAEAPRFS